MPRIRRKSSVRNNVQVSFASSISDLDPEGSVGTELKLIRRIQRKHDKKSKVPSESATSASIREKWNKVQNEDAKNNNTGNFDRIYPNSFANLPADFTKNENVKEKKSSTLVKVASSGNPIYKSRSSSLVGGTPTQGSKRDLFSEQVQQMFEKFGVPLETPPLKNSSRHGKRRKNTDGVRSPKKSKEKPFSSVPSKVDTRWKQVDVFRHMVKMSSQNVSRQQSGLDVKAEGTTKSKSKLKTSERPSILKQKKSSILKTSENEASVPVKKKSSKGERLVMNYPALDTVKDEKNKLPLTIPPKYNTKKVLELTRDIGIKENTENATVNDKKEDVKSLPSNNNPVKKSPEPKNTTANYFEQRRLRKKRFNIGDFLKGSLFDLKKQENNKESERKTSGEKVDKNDTSPMAVSRFSTHMLRAPVKKTESVQSSLQIQPSAFLTTKISVRRRLKKIPTFRVDEDGVPILPKVMFLQTQEFSRLPMQINVPNPLKRFPIPWKYPHNQIMSSKEKKAFPLTKKALQKRNTYAFAYANRTLSDDDGASSPINLLHRSSIAELDSIENESITKSLGVNGRKSSTQVVRVDSVVFSQRASTSQGVNSILLNKKSSESICSSEGRRSRSGSKQRIRFSEENFTRGAKDFNGNTFRSKSQSVCRSAGSSSTTLSNTSSRSSLKGSRQSSPVKRQNSPVQSQSKVSTNKKRPTPPVREFTRLQQAMNGYDTDIEEVDLISPKSFHDVTEVISTVNDTLIQGIVDMVKTVANLFTFSLFRQEENVEPTNSTTRVSLSASTTNTNDTTASS